MFYVYGKNVYLQGVSLQGFRDRLCLVIFRLNQYRYQLAIYLSFSFWFLLLGKWPIIFFLQ